jgi:hypothetical protein
MHNRRSLWLAALFALCFATISCRTPEKDKRVQANYDKDTGKLSQLTVDAKKDGKPNIYSYMDGTKFVRIEIDNDEDGKIDRWEYYGPDQKLEKVGSSRLNDGKPDLWAYQAADGSVAKIEISSKRDGKIDRVEFYEKGALVRAEQDSDGDGRPDKWETYADGAVATVGFDTKHTGTPDRVIDYRKETNPTLSK